MALGTSPKAPENFKLMRMPLPDATNTNTDRTDREADIDRDRQRQDGNKTETRRDRQRQDGTGHTETDRQRGQKRQTERHNKQQDLTNVKCCKWRRICGDVSAGKACNTCVHDLDSRVAIARSPYRAPKPQKCILESEKCHFGPPDKWPQKSIKMAQVSTKQGNFYLLLGHFSGGVQNGTFRTLKCTFGGFGASGLLRGPGDWNSRAYKVQPNSHLRNSKPLTSSILLSVSPSLI